MKTLLNVQLNSDSGFASVSLNIWEMSQMVVLGIPLSIQSYWD